MTYEASFMEGKRAVKRVIVEAENFMQAVVKVLLSCPTDCELYPVVISQVAIL